MNALEALKKIRDDGPVRDYVGICGNVEELTEETMPYELKELMVEWPGNAAKLHSLRQNYPVEGTGDGYEADSEAGTLWDNPRRHELLDWLIKELEPCNQEVYEKGVLVEVCDMPKYKADARCKRLTEETGLLHDWHYFGGRVVIKRLNK